MRAVGFFLLLIICGLLVVRCGYYKELQKDECMYTTELVCSFPDGNIELRFRRDGDTHKVKKCQTSQGSVADVNVDFLMKAIFTAKVNDISVDREACEESSPGVTCQFDKKSKVYEFNESTSTQAIKDNKGDLVEVLVCALYKVAHNLSSSSGSGGDSDWD